MTSAPTAFIGIDVAKEMLMLATWQGRRPWQRPNTPTGWLAIIADLSAHAHPLIVLEATGPYHQGLVRALADAGQTPVVLNPVLSKRFVQSRGQKAKTDRVDAVQLAAYAAQVQPQPRPVPSRAVQTLQMLVSYRADLVKERTSLLNRRGSAPLPCIQRSLDRLLGELDRHLTQIETEMQRCVAGDAELAARHQILRSVPGIGPVIATTLLANLAELGTLGPKPLAALAGIAPYANDSGAGTKPRMIAGGRSSVRTALYQAVLVGLRHNRLVQHHCRRLQARGKPTKVAIIATAHRLLGLLNAMLREGKTWTELTAVQTLLVRSALPT